jgi:hypothetical protein
VATELVWVIYEIVGRQQSGDEMEETEDKNLAVSST